MRGFSTATISAAAALAALSLTAADLTVTNLGNAGAGSLRGQIAAAGSGDTIYFDPALAGTITLASELTITKSMTITGAGADITISGNDSCRAMNIDASGGDYITIADLTITNGMVSAVNASVRGGGIENDENLTLDGVVVMDCAAQCLLASGGSRTASGGAIYHSGDYLTITGCAITGNSAAGFSLTASGYGQGGGLHLADGRIVIIDTLISNNSSTGEPSTIADGGGIITTTAVESLRIDNCVMDGNSSQDNGGGMYFSNLAGAAVEISDSTISNNSAIEGGGICLIGDGAGALLTVTGCGISGNQVASGAVAVAGGGVFASANSESVVNAYLINSTIAGNRAATTASKNAYGGGIYAQTNGGGAIGLNLLNTTVAANEATSTTTSYGRGGGLYLANGTVTIANSVAASNTISSNPSSYGPDIFKGAAATIAAASCNLVATTGGNHGIIDGVDGNIVGSDAMLGPLRDNGGPTDTMAPGPASPALRKIPRGASAPYYNDSPETDQRGCWIDRPTDNPDYLNRTIGAYWDNASPTPARGFKGIIQIMTID